MNTAYRIYLIIAAILGILLTMHLFGNVYAAEFTGPPSTWFSQWCKQNGVSTADPNAVYSYGNTGTQAQPIYVVPKPPYWYVNPTYIPDWETQWRMNLYEWRLRQAQKARPGQQFIDAVPRGERFRR